MRIPIFEHRLKKVIGTKTITDFSNESGISRTTINYWLKGERLPNAKQLITLSNYSGLTIDYLLGLSDYSLVKFEVSK